MKKEKEATLKDVMRTIDNLAATTANGFSSVQKQFDSFKMDVDQRFDAVEKKIESEIQSVKAEISLGIRELKEDVARLDARIDRLFKQTTDDISILIEEQEKIKLRLKKLELKNSHG